MHICSMTCNGQSQDLSCDSTENICHLHTYWNFFGESFILVNFQSELRITALLYILEPFLHSKACILSSCLLQFAINQPKNSTFSFMIIGWWLLVRECKSPPFKNRVVRLSSCSVLKYTKPIILNLCLINVMNCLSVVVQIWVQ